MPDRAPPRTCTCAGDASGRHGCGAAQRHPLQGREHHHRQGLGGDEPRHRACDGGSFAGPFALRLSVEDGRITRHHLYEDGLSIAWACTPG